MKRVYTQKHATMCGIYAHEESLIKAVRDRKRLFLTLLYGITDVTFYRKTFTMQLFSMPFDLL